MEINIDSEVAVVTDMCSLRLASINISQIHLSIYHCMQLKVDLKPRSWHTVRVAYSAAATECRLVVFGGNMHREGNYGDRTATADPRILVFGMYQSFLFA